MTSSRHCVYLALGSNLGDRSANLQAALAAMPPQAKVIAVSPVYETAPWGYPDQPDFLNQAAQIETDLAASDLLAHLKRIETRLGRQATFRYGPRLIDLDILFFDDLIIQSPGLTIPHPHLHERAFVLAPLADLAPNLVHPVLGLTISDLLAQVDTSEVARWAPSPI